MISRQVPLLRRLLDMQPATLILLSFLFVIAVGTCLLTLPISTHAGSIPLIDALFTATSAVCVTGLTVVDPGTCYTKFGQWVIVLLIQIGGLGLMTISVALFRLIGRSIPFKQRMAMQDVFAHVPREDILKLVKHVVLFTLLVELGGVILLTIHWADEFSLGRSVYLGVFHSISAFCNAGFSLFPDNFMRYSGSWLLNFTICGLIVVGGIGFPVLHDLYLQFRHRKGKRGKLTVQTKTVLVTTAVLIAGGALVFGFLERDFVGARVSVAERVLTPVFQSITCRTAGFNTVDIGALGDATLFLMIFLMFVGASPGSTGGGVKTTTLAVISAFSLSRLRRSRRVNMFKKTIPDETVVRSASLILISISVIGIVLFLILISSAASQLGATGFQRPFLAYFFETVSAFGTVGLSMGATASLTTWSKAWIVAMMIIGRVGVLTFSYVIVGSTPKKGIEYAEEGVMIG
jgi:trk system potassium uptake protein TrkH